MVTTEQAFFNTLLELNYTRHFTEKNVQHAAELASQLPQYEGWPNHPQRFWNAEALCWKGRIGKDVRETIAKELSFLHGGSNLDLGAGSYSYIPNSVAADFAEEMLLLNDAEHKVVLDLEQKLPFDDHLFDSVTMAFVVNYVQNVEQLFREAKRVLKSGGVLAVVNASVPVVELHRMHYKNFYGEPELRMLLQKHQLRVHSSVKNVSGNPLAFVFGRKII